MARLRFSELAFSDLEEMDGSIVKLFYQHFDKIIEMPPRKHLKHGVPFFKENVDQGRIAYQVEGDTIYIVRCFKHHKEYDKWLSTFK